MDKIEESLQKVKKELFNNPSVKEYFRLKDIVKNDKTINELNKEIKLHQKLMCQNKNNDEIYFKEKELYESNLKLLESNPIYVNFNEIKEEVNVLLVEVRDTLN